MNPWPVGSLHFDLEEDRINEHKERVVKTFEGLREKYRAFYDRVKAFHEANPSTRQRGHGMEHNVHVALHGIDIVLHDHDHQPILLQAVFLASIAHSLDRLVDRGDDAGFAALTRECLALSGVEPEIAEAVFLAVVEHGKKNSDEDNLITVVLKDADRVANIGAALAIRSGQFYSGLPPYEMAYLRTVNPAHTYHDPASVLEDLRECFVWESWMRTSRGKTMFHLKAENLRRCISMIAEEFESIGMDKVEI